MAEAAQLDSRAGRQQSWETAELLWQSSYSCCCPLHPSKGALESENTAQACHPRDTAAVPASPAASAFTSHSEGLWALRALSHTSATTRWHTPDISTDHTGVSWGHRTELKSLITFHGQIYRSVLQKLVLFIYIQQLRDINLFPQIFPTSFPRDYSFFFCSQQEVLQGLDKIHNNFLMWFSRENFLVLRQYTVSIYKGR